MNWSTSISVCNWIGITCNARHGRFATIHLPDMGLIGTTPPHLGNLSFLAKFNITNNAFHGELPKELANLRRLKYLVLALNNFVGGFRLWLREFSYLKILKYLHIPSNKPRGSFPQALFNLSSLKVLAFANNGLSGYLPARIYDQLPQLKALDLLRIEIQGEIPWCISECSNLEFSGMLYSKIVGKIPRGIWDLTMLTRLHLGGLGIEDCNRTDAYLPREDAINTLVLFFFSTVVYIICIANR
ncbi:hypothetical protein ACH5RR_036403, partial [Cinchona calisaya]